MAKFKVVHPKGPIAGRVRFGETDNDTRGSDRKDVTVLPARRTIINVYQLFNKLTAQATGKRKQAPMGRPPSGKKSKQEREKTEATQQEEKRRTRRSKTHFYDEDVYWKTIDGEKVNTFKLPFKRPGEVQSEYNARATEFARVQQYVKKNPDYAGFKLEETVTELNEPGKPARSPPATPEISMGAGIVRSAKEVAKEKVKAIRYDDTTDTGKLYTLGGIAKAEKIPTQKKVVTDLAYSERNPVDDYDTIRKAINVAKAENKIRSPTPAIIAVAPLERNPPTAYYIRNDLSYRRKRHIVSKIKRHVKPAARISKKRRVVIKRKGGKR